jgi:hypothetical protein
MSIEQHSTIQEGIVTPFQLEQLREKYTAGKEFDPIKANVELQELVSRFDAKNLEGERLAEQITVNDDKGRQNTEALATYLAASQQVMDLSSAVTRLSIQLHQLQKGTPAYKAIRQKRGQTARALGQASREAKRLSRKHKNSTDDFLHSFELKRPRYNLFSRYTRYRLRVVKSGLVAIAIILTLGLDQIVIAFDDKWHGRTYAYFYHAGLFTFFALVDRFGVRPLEEYAFATMARNIFNKGLNFLSNQLKISDTRVKNKIEGFRSRLKTSV